MQDAINPTIGESATERAASPDEQFYEIVLDCQLDDRWSEWFAGMKVTNLENGQGMLSGCLPDQVALHGLLARVRDLNLALVSVKRIDPPSKEIGQCPNSLDANSSM